MHRLQISFRELLLAHVFIALTPLLASGEEVERLARLSSSRPALGHPIDPALEIVTASLEHVQANVDDYTALFVKRCRVAGVLPPLQFAKLKIRQRKTGGDQIARPLSVYLDYLKPKSVKGREVIWVESENDGNMVVHQGGLASFLTLNIDPEGLLAMRGQRYSIKEIGIENLLQKIVAIGRQDRQYGECEVHIDHNVKLGKLTCTMLDIRHPVKRDHFRFHRALVYFDNSVNLPVRFQAWTWPEMQGGQPILDEEYNYYNLKINADLSPADFDSANPNYRFR